MNSFGRLRSRWSLQTLGLATLFLFVFLLSSGFAIGPVGGGDPTPVDPAMRGHHVTMMVVYAVVALACSFLCSVAEAVMLSVSPSFILKLEQEKVRGAAVLKSVKANIDRSLAAILTLNTIAHTIGAGGAGAEAAKAFGDENVTLSMAILTLLILFLSEIIPKTIGAVYWRGLATWTARFVQWLIWLLFPLIFVSELLTKLLTRGKSVHGFNREEFRAMADIGAAGGHLDAKESRILKNLFRFPELCAEDIMTPSTVVFALQQDLSVAEVLNQHADISFSRIPIYGENRDDVTGFVLKTDLLLDQYRNDGKTVLRELKRDIHAVDEDKPLTFVLEQLLDHRDNTKHVLLVVDKYGGMEGLLTLEDVVETLIGFDIVDEADQINNMRKLAREKWKARRERNGLELPPSE